MYISRHKIHISIKMGKRKTMDLSSTQTRNYYYLIELVDLMLESHLDIGHWNVSNCLLASNTKTTIQSLSAILSYNSLHEPKIYPLHPPSASYSCKLTFFKLFMNPIHSSISSPPWTLREENLTQNWLWCLQ